MACIRVVDEQAADGELLRAAGFSDEGVFSLGLVVSDFNVVNRMALGLGVRFDDDEAKGYRC